MVGAAALRVVRGRAGVGQRVSWARYSSSLTDVFAPGRFAVGDGEMGHGVFVGGAAPVPFGCGGPIDVARSDGDDGFAAGLDEAVAVGDPQRLPVLWECQAVRAPG